MLKANAALLTASGKFSMGKISPIIFGETNKCETSTKLPPNEILTFKIRETCCHVHDLWGWACLPPYCFCTDTVLACSSTVLPDSQHCQCQRIWLLKCTDISKGMRPADKWSY